VGITFQPLNRLRVAFPCGCESQPLAGDRVDRVSSLAADGRHATGGFGG